MQYDLTDKRFFDSKKTDLPYSYKPYWKDLCKETKINQFAFVFTGLLAITIISIIYHFEVSGCLSFFGLLYVSISYAKFKQAKSSEVFFKHFEIRKWKQQK